MTEPEPTHERTGLNKARLVAAALEIGGIVIVVGLLAYAALWLFDVSRSGFPAVSQFITPVVLVLGGFALGLLLWGASEMVRRLDAVHEAFQRNPSAADEDEDEDTLNEASGGAGAGGGERMDELVALMRETRDISLLNEKQRAQRLEIQGKALVQLLEAEVPALLREHNWVDARERVQKALERFPGLAPLNALAKQIESVRSEVEARDIETATRQVNDLASLGAWDRAMDVVRDLLQRHPGSTKANELSRRVSVERDKAEAEERGRLMARAQDATNRRDWADALSLANLLIRRYPHSSEAEALRAQLPTLETNAEVLARQRQESEYKSLVEQQRYADALRVARDLVERFPDSPQARALQPQIPQLEERAASAEAAL